MGWHDAERSGIKSRAGWGEDDRTVYMVQFFGYGLFSVLFVVRQGFQQLPCALNLTVRWFVSLVSPEWIVP